MEPGVARKNVLKQALESTTDPQARAYIHSALADCSYIPSKQEVDKMRQHKVRASNVLKKIQKADSENKPPDIREEEMIREGRRLEIESTLLKSRLPIAVG